MNKKIYIVKVLSVHEVTYAISSKQELKEIQDEVEKKINRYGPAELHQKWDGEKIQSIEGPMTEDEFIKYHDELFPDLSETDRDNKLFVVNYERLHEEMTTDEGFM